VIFFSAVSVVDAKPFAISSLPLPASSLRGARDKIAKQFCAEATKQSMPQQVERWIASLRSQ
jgi:hypothetical protein